MAKTLPLFKLGLGGPIGSGRQWWPWISIDDEVGAIVHLLTADVSGPVNLTAPTPVRHKEYAAAQGRALRRPAFLPTPKLGPKLVLGSELAAALLGDSQRVVPAKLLASGYEFRRPTIDEAMRDLLK
jgi:NAD dependent epimerase/dehydratase family enzyme